MTDSLKSVLKRLGLFEVVRDQYRSMHAGGLLPWTELVPADAFSANCDRVVERLSSIDHEFGDYLEFGVSRGTSMSCMFHALQRASRPDVRLIGFDSFEGLPAVAAEQGWAPGEFASTMSATRKYLKKAGVNLERVQLIEGWFEDTATPKTAARLEINKASVIMIDCDIYQSTREALAFCAPLIRDAAVIMFDDWGARAEVNEIGQREAWAEFRDANQRLAATELSPYVPQAKVFLVEATGGQSADHKTERSGFTV